MPLPLTTAARDAIAAESLSHAWLLELHTDEGTLYGWDKRADLAYDGQTWEGLGSSWEIAGEISSGTELVPRPLTLTFDGSDASDSSSFVGRLVDRQWHQRKVRLRGLLLLPGSHFRSVVGTHLEWNGFMDTLEDGSVDGGLANIILTCESGLFRALDRNMTTCTDADQKRRDATDNFFQNTATKPTQDIPFGTSWSKVPGTGGRSSGGGGNPINSTLNRLL